MDAVTQPYVEKVQTTTKPYTDAAATKARELMDKIEVSPAHLLAPLAVIALGELIARAQGTPRGGTHHLRRITQRQTDN